MSPEQRAHERRVEEIWEHSGFGTRHKRQLGDHLFESRAWAESYQSASESLRDTGGLVALLGPRGTGKTQLATCLGWERARRRATVRYLVTEELFFLLEEARAGDKGQLAVLNRLHSPSLLILDEIHMRSESDYQCRVLTFLIDRRYLDEKDTILISNQSQKDFFGSLGPSVASRFAEAGCVLLCDWQSFRRPKED